MIKLRIFDTNSLFCFNAFIILIFLILQNKVYSQTEGLVFSKTTFDFGVIPLASTNNIAVFKYVYDGNEPLTITNVSTSCGCSTPVWSKTQINKGDKGEITVNYNSKSKMGE
jgi:hypothetical protein